MPRKAAKNTGSRNQNGSVATAGAKSSAFKQKATTSASKNKQHSLRKVFEKELNDIYDAEKQLLKALPEMAKAADSEDLQDAFELHMRQTQKQVERLEKIFERTGITPQQETCEAMEGLIKECKEVISEFDRSAARDAALIIGAQKVEHYEIATYGSLCELADVMGMQKVADIFDRTLEEEEETDELLTDIAKDVNDEAAEMMQGQSEESEMYETEEEDEDEETL